MSANGRTSIRIAAMRRTRWLAALAAGVLLGAAGCAGCGMPGATDRDASSPAPDSGTPDAGAAEAGTEDAGEGVQAFLEKRPPKWQGH